MKMFLFGLPTLLIYAAEIIVIIYCIRTLYIIKKEQREIKKQVENLLLQIQLVVDNLSKEENEKKKE